MRTASSCTLLREATLRRLFDIKTATRQKPIEGEGKSSGPSVRYGDFVSPICGCFLFPFNKPRADPDGFKF